MSLKSFDNTKDEEYKNNFSGCKTINGTYDKKAKTIKVQIWELY